jgi:hypothetical protein
MQVFLKNLLYFLMRFKVENRNRDKLFLVKLKLDEKTNENWIFSLDLLSKNFELTFVFPFQKNTNKEELKIA